jgi:hypothetical protein
MSFHWILTAHKLRLQNAVSCCVEEQQQSVIVLRGRTLAY